jgi:hypothetical protein
MLKRRFLVPAGCDATVSLGPMNHEQSLYPFATRENL